jgi:hypothetical protein
LQSISLWFSLLKTVIVYLVIPFYLIAISLGSE